MTEASTNGEILNEGLAALGFERSQHLGATVWSGKHQGRGCTIRVSRQGRTRYAGEVRLRQHLGFRLRIELETPVRTRLYFVKQSFTSGALVGWIYRWRRQEVVDSVPEVLAGFTAVTKERAWAQRLLEEREAMEDVAHLLRDGASPKLMGSVHLSPGEVHYGSPILAAADVTLEKVADSIRRLERIAQAAERIPPPQTTEELGRFERFAKSSPLAAALLFLGGCLALLFVFALLLFVGLLLVSKVLSAG